MLIGIRREDKNEWERRVPLTPDAMARLRREHAVEFRVQPSPIRVFPDEAYREAGAQLTEDLSACDLILGVKEIPPELLAPEKAYLFFSHVIKCQAYNMPMLRRLLELRDTLFDYELIADDQGRRLVFFGRFAGLAGMIDTLHALGQRLASEGIESPFHQIRMAHAYSSLTAAREAIAELGERIRTAGLPQAITPLVVGITGYGNVSQGAQEILDLLPVREIAPAELPALRQRPDLSARCVYKTVFKEEHLVRPRAANGTFELQDYYQHPEKYVSVFETYTPHLDLLVNCIFWTADYPRLITKEGAARLQAAGNLPLRVIGDISCDIEGSIELTVKVTTPAAPCFAYDPASGRVRDGCAGPGPVIMAVDNLPCELPRESSAYFSETLHGFLGEFASADLRLPFEQVALSAPLRRAVIAWRGALQPKFRFLEKCLQEDAAPDA